MNNSTFNPFDLDREDKNKDEQSGYSLIKNSDLRDEFKYDEENMSIGSILKRVELDNEELIEKEDNQNDNNLNEFINLENVDNSNKIISENSNPIELLKPLNEPEKNFLCNKRRKGSFDSSNEKISENPNNEKIDIVPKNNSSLVPDIKKFHTFLNIYFKYLMENGNSFNTSAFDQTGGPNGFYINKDFTQLALGAKVHSSKLNEKITKYIKEKKLEKLKEKKDETRDYNCRIWRTRCSLYG